MIMLNKIRLKLSIWLMGGYLCEENWQVTHYHRAITGLLSLDDK